MLNNKGPSTDPCGTPCIKSVHELKVLLIFTRCFLLSNLTELRVLVH